MESHLYMIKPNSVSCLKNRLFKAQLTLLLLGLMQFSFFAFAQSATITDVQPRRATTGSVVTVTGTDFYSGLEETLRFDPGGYDITGPGNRIFVNSTTMTFTITQDDFTPRSQALRFTPTSGGAEVTTSFIVDYVAPIKKIHKVNGSNQINPRVEEIYTDFSDVIEFKDGDLFNTGENYNSTQFGKWEFYSLEFPATPHGVLVEAGGTGRGMFIGFNDAGNLVARGGDGQPGTPAGCARLEIMPGPPGPSTYDFAGKFGTLIVTMNPNTGVLTLTFDEFNNGTINFTQTVTASAGFLGAGGDIEWSGGNDGFVGYTDGSSLAGTELTDPLEYDFNGEMGGLLFVNNLNSDIAWRSSLGSLNCENNPSAICPDNDHDLLGFKMVGGTVYSTGANDELLEFYLGSEIVDATGEPLANYVRQTYKAYSTNGVQNTTVSSHHIFTGDLLDGTYNEGPTEFDTSTDPAFEKIRGLSMFDVLYDGKNGLNIGTGINNLNESTTIEFFSGNGEVGAVPDNIPDLLIPNMAEAGGTDVYYFTDEKGNVIGRPISLEINNNDTDNPPLSHWINDQYRVDLGVSFEIAKPTERIYGQKQERPMRLIALKLSDFQITDEPVLTETNKFTNIKSIFNINAGAGGTADVPFLAYNGDSFEIRSPVVIKRPVPRSVCEADGTVDASFLVEATVDGQEDNPGYEPSPEEALTYQWFKYNDNIDGTGSYSNMSGWTTSQLNINNINTAELGLYRLKISNTFGTTIVSVTIEDGGTRVSWNGTNFIYPPGFTESSVADADRKLVMLEDYDIPIAGTLEGCSCEVFAGNEVQVRKGGTLKLFDELNLKQADTIFVPGTKTIDSIIPRGKFILEDNASLVQTKPVTFNQNTGAIVMQREASNLDPRDYVYWSSPVEEFDLSGIPGNLTYQWETNTTNANGTLGNWVEASGEMVIGKGYIKRVASATNFTTDFEGRPNNGEIIIGVETTTTPTANPDDNNWNLIGNPYPSAIDALKFLELDSNENHIDGFVQIWTHYRGISSTASSPYYQNFGVNYNDDYLTYNATGSSMSEPSGITFNGNIAAGQGFLVKATNTGNVIFKNELRYDGPSNLDNTDFFRGNSKPKAKESPEKQLIWLSLVNDNSGAVSTLVGYVEGATFERDRMFDASTSGSGFSIHSMIDEDKMSIQGRPFPFVDTDIVPLGVQLNKNGIFSIAIADLKGSEFVDAAQDIYLEDVYTGMIHDLRTAPYSFTAEKGELNDRFLLRYTNDNNTLSVTDNNVADTFVFVRDGILNIRSKNQIKTVEVYDLTGKRVVRHFAMGETELSKDFNYASGVYFVSLLFNDSTVLSKKVLN